jgi:hypothetical protein
VLDNPDARQQHVKSAVRGNVRKGVGLAVCAKLKGRTIPRCKPVAEMRAATPRLSEGCRPWRGNAPVDVLLGVMQKEAELAMRDEPDVELKCQSIRSSRSLKRC